MHRGSKVVLIQVQLQSFQRKQKQDRFVSGPRWSYSFICWLSQRFAEWHHSIHVNIKEWKVQTHIQGFEAVPAEGVLAVLAHHLCTALIPLDVDFTFRTALDWCIILFILIERAGEKRDMSPMRFPLHSWYKISNHSTLTLLEAQEMRLLLRSNQYLQSGVTGLCEIGDSSGANSSSKNHQSVNGLAPPPTLLLHPPVGVGLSVYISPVSVKCWLCSSGSCHPGHCPETANKPTLFQGKYP